MPEPAIRVDLSGFKRECVDVLEHRIAALEATVERILAAVPTAALPDSADDGHPASCD